MSKHEREAPPKTILSYFHNLPDLNFDKYQKDGGLKMGYPKLDQSGVVDLGYPENSQTKSEPAETHFPTLKRLSETAPGQPSGSDSLDAIREAIEKASQKMVFGVTTLQEWERRLVFVNDEVVRDDQDWTIKRATDDKWTEDLPINTSLAVANDWFNTHLTPAVQSDKTSRGFVVSGTAGSGKSTLFKYLISRNFDQSKAQKVVFSRFEFSKITDNLDTDTDDEFDRNVEKYIARIHVRDLLLHKFMTIRDCHELEFEEEAAPPASVSEVQNGDRVVLRFVPPHGRGRPDKLPFEDRLDDAVTQIGKSFHLIYERPPQPEDLENIRDLILSLNQGRESLRNALNGATVKFLHVFIHALAVKENRMIVTIFDGIDAVKPEEILKTGLKEHRRWTLAKRVMQKRNRYGNHHDDRGHPLGIQHLSILVIRNTTRAGLAHVAEDWARDVQNLPRFQVGSVAVFPAGLSMSLASIDNLPEFFGRSDQDKLRLANLLMRPYLRQLNHVFKGQVKDPDDTILDDLFHGNLRKLFRFQSKAWEWTRIGMFIEKYLERDFVGEYHRSAEATLEAMASSAGLLFLERKAYRSVEAMLTGGRPVFENAVRLQRSEMIGGDGYKVDVEWNKKYAGVIDNVLNYTIERPVRKNDDHMLLEKVRILQILDQRKTLAEFRTEIKEDFGYDYDNDEYRKLQEFSSAWDKLLFLIQTGFVVVSLDPSDSTNQRNFYFETSSRGRLALRLLENLGYIENIFHRTLFPEILIEVIKDMPRPGQVETWSSQAIRNAFVFLTYLKKVEHNHLRGKNSQRAKDGAYYLFDRVYRGLMSHVGAIVADSGKPNAAHRERNIASDAQVMIEDIVADWKKKGLIDASYALGTP